MAADETDVSEFHMMGSDPSKELILTDYDKVRVCVAAFVYS